MPGRDVTLTIKVNDADVDSAIAKQTRFNASVKAGATDATQALGVNNAAIKKHVQDLQAAMSQSESSFNDTVRSYRTELLKLNSDLRAGSVDTANYQARFKLLPASMQEAVLAAQSMGKGLDEVAVKGGNVVKGLESLEAATGRTGRQLRLAQQGMSELGAAGGPVAVILLAVAAAVGVFLYSAVKAEEVVVSLATGFAKYGGDLEQARQQTGLMATTIVALRHEADATGTSFSDIQSATTAFRKNIGEAAANSDTARQGLKLLGIDGKRAILDIDGAFKQAITTIVKLPPGMDQARAVFAAFGEDGYKLIPFFQSFNGNVDEAIKKTAELGIQMSGKDIEASKAFNRSLQDAKDAVEGFKLAFGRQFLDAIASAINGTTNFLRDNASTINSWAQTAGTGVKLVVGYFRELFTEIRNLYQFTQDHPIIAGLATGGLSSLLPHDLTSGGLPQGGATLANYDPTLQANRNTAGAGVPDPAALEAQRAEMEKKQKEAIEAAKKSWDAAIESWKLYGTQAEKVLSDTYTKLKDEFNKSGDSKTFIASVSAALQQFVDQTTGSLAELDKLEDERARRNKVSENEMTLLHQQQQARRNAIDELGQKIAREGNDAVAANNKKVTADQAREAEEAMRKQMQLATQRDQHDIDDRKYAVATLQATDQQYLDFVNNQTVESYDRRIAALKKYLADYGTSVDAKKRAQIQGEIDQIADDERYFKQQLDEGRILTAEAQARRDVSREINKLTRDNADPSIVAGRQKAGANTEQLSLMQQLTALQDTFANGGVNDGLKIAVAHWTDIVALSHKELDAVIAIDHAQTQLDHQMDLSATEIRSKVLSHLAEQKTLVDGIAGGINKTYDAVSQKLDDQIDKMFKWAGAFQGLFAEPIKAIMGIGIGKLTTGLMDAIMPSFFKNQTNNPIAKPIVSAIDETNKLLTMLVMRSGGGSAGVGLGGLSLGGLLSGVGGMGPGGTPYFNPSGGTIGRGAIPPTGTITIGPDGQPMYTVNGNQPGGGVLGNLRQLFSTGQGGIFAPPTNPFTGEQQSGAMGIASGIGQLVAMAGGLIGGRVGGVLSMAGTGLAIGSMFGPIGAVVGTAAGALIGIFQAIFGGNKQRKQDEATRNQGMLDALASINKAYDDVSTQLKFGQIDPASAITQASGQSQQARAQYLQMANGLTDKKTRNIALADVSRLDTLISTRDSQLRALADRAQASADIAKRILPEFAGGTYFADYFRPNGLIPGVFDSRDDMMAMLSRGEMVLNPTQQAKVRRQAGFDVFAGAGIPNYPSPNMAGGGTVTGTLGGGSITINPSFTIELVGVPITDSMQAYLVSDDGERVMVDLVKRKKKSGDI